MRKIIGFFLGITIASFLFCEEFILEQGKNKLELNYIPKRIATDSAIVTRVLDVLQIDLVGAPVSMTKIPDRYNEVIKIGRAGSPDYEIMKNLNLDLVISTTFAEFSTAERYKQLGIPVFYIDLESYEASKESLKMLGLAFQKEDISNNLLKDIEKREKIIINKAQKQKPKRIAVLYNLDSTVSIISKDHFVSELISKINCINVSNEVEGKVNNRAKIIPFSVEKLVYLNPDYILKIAPDELKNDLLKDNELLKVTNAYKNNKILNISSTLFRMSSGVNGIEALEELYKIVYEEQEIK
ncbi:siderophore ABC transporter substrate-binding protein [Fusobacterium ulcerans]|uniref:ABC transporter substrate-binding protein n=1 Tax=Fusobacterium ulcerans TaxID=861 RepID=UPI0034C00340